MWRVPRVRLALAAALVAALLGALAPSVQAAGRATFEAPSATSTFETGVTFAQPVALSETPKHVELLLTLPGALGPLVLAKPVPATPGATTLHASFGDPTDGTIRPNTLVAGRWRITWQDGRVALGPSAEVRYADDRFDWRTEQGRIVRVHWYEGDAAFGKRALAIGEQGVAKAEALLGVTESEPIDFFVYADQGAFYDALGPGTPENVGGEAHADIRTMFANITPSSIDDSWVGIVIPHELTHLVFDTATDNVYHQPPRWLNEGLAVYLSQGYDASDRGLVRDAAGSGGLIPLDGLVSGFPRDRDGFYLAYAESVSAIDYLVRTYGQDALVTLIRSYADGTSDDAAFAAALGLDTAAFNAAWFADVDAPVPSPLGPQPDVVGPLPPGWAAPSGAPVASAVPQASASSGAAAPAPGTPASPASSGSALLLIAGLVALLLVVAIGGTTLARRRARAAISTPGWGSPGDASPSSPASEPWPTSGPGVVSQGLRDADWARPVQAGPVEPPAPPSGASSAWAPPPASSASPSGPSSTGGSPFGAPPPDPPPPDAPPPTRVARDDTPGPGGPSDDPDR
jgi:hypothetical protein